MTRTILDVLKHYLTHLIKNILKHVRPPTHPPHHVGRLFCAPPLGVGVGGKELGVAAVWCVGQDNILGALKVP